ncbi:MAG TPA: hypothetical protein VMT86_18515 [Bryobacteraceae bacterium]|nr:hypothetical protein [Bryobacteraceae bacterium]
MSEDVKSVRLNPETVLAFQTYVQEAETAMEQTVAGGDFLWSDREPKRARQVRGGKIAAEFWHGKGPLKVESGLIHDWIGAVLIPGATMEATLARIQDYDNHKLIYRPEVIASKLIARSGDDFQIYLRVLKKKIITVVLDTDHDVHYFTVDSKRGGCRSYTTRTAEVDNAGKPDEVVQRPDSGYGFLWRLNSYWRFEQRAEGLYAECRAISLTRDIPAALRWIIDPIVRSLPKESLVHTLKATRDAIAGHGAQGPRAKSGGPV